jgi:hypothetical protein
MAQQINDTGVRGFLKWLKVEQPGLYPRVAKEIAARAPGAFDDYHAGGWRIAGLGQNDAMQALTFDTSLVSAPTVDISDAADAGGKSSSITDTIASVVKGISALYLTKKQADVQQQVVNTQLQRAAMGLPPLPQSLANLGVPQVNVGLQGNTGIALAVGGGILLLVFGFGMFGRGSARR